MSKQKEMSALEKEYRETFDARQSEILEEVEKARTHLLKATELADKYGIPFDEGISFIDGCPYIPSSAMDEGEFAPAFAESLSFCLSKGLHFDNFRLV